MAIDWESISRDIISTVDVLSVYQEVGVEITGREPNREGWIECRAFGRDDHTPSAAINIGVGQSRGRYKDFASNDSFGLFDFLAQYGGYVDWKAARAAMAEKAGIQVGRHSSDGPLGDVYMEDWNTILVSHWCSKKNGVTPRSLKECGGYMGAWPKKKRTHPVVGLPVFDENLRVCGTIVWNRTGGTMPVYQGAGIPPRQVKVKTLTGSVSGFMGPDNLRKLAAAKYVWKVEGPTDMLALWARIPDSLRHEHIVITNSGGCSEIPLDKFVKLLTGKKVMVCHDADEPGQFGAERWAQKIAEYAAETRNVRLPYEIAEKQGRDLRDWLTTEGNGYGKLLELAALTPLTQRSAPPPPRAIPGQRAPFTPPTDVIDAILNDMDREEPDDSNDDREQEAAVQRHDDVQPTTTTQSTEAPLVVEYSSIIIEPPPRAIPEVAESVIEASVTNTQATDVRSSSPDEIARDEDICRRLQLDVLGEINNGKIKVFSSYHRKSEIIPDLNRLSYEKILQLCGPPAREVINRTKEYIIGQYTVDQVREAIGMLAGYRRIKDESERGVGVWQGKSIVGEKTDTVILVGAGEAARLNGKPLLTKITTPRADGLLLDLSSSHHWYDHANLNSLVKRAYSDKEWVKSRIDAAIEIFSRWLWKNQEVDPLTMTGLVLASWIQTLWEWRPLVAVTGSSNSGKALAIDTLIPTPHGWKKMSDLRVGNKVFDENGKPCNVIAVTEVMHGHECFEVEFSSGEKIVADAQHQWMTRKFLKSNKWSISTTEEISESIGTNNRRGRNHSVNVCGPLQMKKKDFLVPPYTLGCWLSDGTATCSQLNISMRKLVMLDGIRNEGVTVTSIDIQEGVEKVSCKLGVVGKGSRQSLHHKLRRIGVLGNKHIPAEYFLGSIEQRKALLRGILDGDSSVDKKTGAVEYTTSDKVLADGVLELMRSLGIKVVPKKRHSTLYGVRKKDRYRFSFMIYREDELLTIPFRVNRLHSRPKNLTRSKSRQIVSVTKVESVPVKCIQVDSPSSLYLAGEGMIPTHNSSIFKCLGGDERGAKGMFGALALLSSQSTEAGIRQSIKNDAIIILCDEFDSASKNRDKLLELFRTGSRGSKIFRGTAGQSAEAFGLQHIVWVAGIEIGLDREPDRNRFIMLELLTAPDEDFGKLVIPGEDIRVSLGQDLLAIALTHSAKAIPLAVKLKSTDVDGIDRRVIESYAVPASILATCYGYDHADAERLLRALLGCVEKRDQGRGDVNDLLDDILSARVDCGGGKRLSVSQIVFDKSGWLENSDALDSHGIAVTGKEDEYDGIEQLFIAHRTVKKMLLKGTQWERSSIDQILKRVPGARLGRYRVACQRPRGILIPMPWIAENFANAQS